MKFQDEVKEFAKKNNLQHKPEVHVLDLMTELGEVAKEILKATDYGKKEFKSREELKSELGDAFYSLLMVANACNVDLEQALKLVLEKYKKRLQKGGAGSEFE
jgi:NTP pyrophosphatase (non-canonical NTP hydrolase)